MKSFLRLSPLSLTISLLFVSYASAEMPLTPESARPYGMGDAFSAVANDLNAILFNPAGLSTVKQIEAGVNAQRTLSGGSPQTELSAAAAVPLNFYRDTWESGTAGFLLHSNGGSGEDAVTNLSVSGAAAPHDVFREGRWLPSSWIPERLYTGGTLRLRRITHGITGGTAYGFGMDIGFLYQFDNDPKSYKDGWSASLVFQEMNMKTIGGGSTIRLGAAWRQPKYTLALDMVTRNGVTRFLPGAEASFFKKLLLLRAGTGVVPEKERQVVLGIGTLLPPIELDLAYGFPVSNLDKPNDRVVVTFTYRFGTPFLGQYLEEADKRKSAEAEMSLSNLEYKKATLEAGIRESKSLYEKIDADLKKTRQKTEMTQKDLELGEKKLAEQKERILKLNKEIQAMEQKKTSTEDQVNKLKARTPELGRKVFKHTVAKGETLRSLAEKYYGDPNKWTVIFEANQDKIKRGVLKVGQELTVP